MQKVYFIIFVLFSCQAHASVAIDQSRGRKVTGSAVKRPRNEDMPSYSPIRNSQAPGDPYSPSFVVSSHLAVGRKMATLVVPADPSAPEPAPAPEVAPRVAVGSVSPEPRGLRRSSADLHVLTSDFIYKVNDGKERFLDDMDYFPEHLDLRPSNSVLSSFYKSLAEFFLNREEPQTINAAKAYKLALEIMKQDPSSFDQEIIDMLVALGIGNPLTTSQDEIQKALTSNISDHAE